MFCTQCGTQVDEGKKFCRNCGARIAKAEEPASTMVLPKVDPSSLTQASESESAAMPTQSSVSETQPIMMFPKPRQGISVSVIVTGALLFLAVAGLGLYFGTHLFRESTAPEPVAEAPLINSAPPPVAAVEGDKIPEGPSERDLNAALQSPPPAEPLPSLPMDVPAAKEPAPQPLGKSAGATQPRQPAGASSTGNVPPQERVARAPIPTDSPRPTFVAGTYETLRSTNVFDGPSGSSRIVAGIERGVRINVVAAKGEWLEVRSRHGNPPGFIRKDDARLVERQDGAN